MAINFPSSPTEGQVHNHVPGLSFVYRSGAWMQAPVTTALPKNYFTNPAMQISQENGDTASGFGPGPASYYAADEFCCYWNTPGASVRLIRLAGDVTTLGSKVVNVYNNIAKAALANGDYVQFYKGIENLRATDLAWGTASARQVVIRFSVNSSIANHTFNIFIQEPVSPPPRVTFNKLCTYTVTPGQWQDFTVVVPGPTTGWVAADCTIWFYFYVAVGPNYTSGAVVDGSWQVLGDTANHPLGITNFLAPAAASFSITNIGFYSDPYKTGVAPPFEIPVEFDELRRCKRHWHRGQAYYGGVTSATMASRMCGRHPVPMRAMPVAGIRGVPRIYNVNAQPIITTVGNASNAWSGDFDMTCAAGGLVPGYAATMTYTNYDSYIAVDARG